MATEFKFYHYDPSMVGAVIFTIAFLITTSLHSYQLLQTRTWFMIPMVVGGFCLSPSEFPAAYNLSYANDAHLVEWIGYVGRALSSQQSPDWTLGPYLVQTLLLLVAPALFAASIYMELSRVIILADGESHALIKKKWLTKLFVCGDVVSFLLQMGGKWSTHSL
jgi:hypothetical protein